MPAQASGDVAEDDVAVIELDGERRARENLLDAADYLKWGFLDILRRGHFGHAHAVSLFSIANSYD